MKSFSQIADEAMKAGLYNRPAASNNNLQPPMKYGAGRGPAWGARKHQCTPYRAYNPYIRPAPTETTQGGYVKVTTPKKSQYRRPWNYGGGQTVRLPSSADQSVSSTPCASSSRLSLSAESSPFNDVESFASRRTYQGVRSPPRRDITGTRSSPDPFSHNTASKSLPSPSENSEINSGHQMEWFSIVSRPCLSPRTPSSQGINDSGTSLDDRVKKHPPKVAHFTTSPIHASIICTPPFRKPIRLKHGQGTWAILAIEELQDEVKTRRLDAWKPEDRQYLAEILIYNDDMYYYSIYEYQGRDFGFLQQKALSLRVDIDVTHCFDKSLLLRKIAEFASRKAVLDHNYKIKQDYAVWIRSQGEEKRERTRQQKRNELKAKQTEDQRVQKQAHDLTKLQSSVSVKHASLSSGSPASDILQPTVRRNRVQPNPFVIAAVTSGRTANCVSAVKSAKPPPVRVFEREVERSSMPTPSPSASTTASPCQVSINVHSSPDFRVFRAKNSPEIRSNNIEDRDKNASELANLSPEEMERIRKCRRRYRKEEEEAKAARETDCPPRRPVSLQRLYGPTEENDEQSKSKFASRKTPTGLKPIEQPGPYNQVGSPHKRKCMFASDQVSETAAVENGVRLQRPRTRAKRHFEASRTRCRIPPQVLLSNISRRVCRTKDAQGAEEASQPTRKRVRRQAPVEDDNDLKMEGGNAPVGEIQPSSSERRKLKPKTQPPTPVAIDTTVEEHESDEQFATRMRQNNEYLKARQRRKAEGSGEKGIAKIRGNKRKSSSSIEEMFESEDQLESSDLDGFVVDDEKPRKARKKTKFSVTGVESTRFFKSV